MATRIKKIVSHYTLRKILCLLSLHHCKKRDGSYRKHLKIKKLERMHQTKFCLQCNALKVENISLFGYKRECLTLPFDQNYNTYSLIIILANKACWHLRTLKNPFLFFRLFDAAIVRSVRQTRLSATATFSKAVWFDGWSECCGNRTGSFIRLFTLCSWRRR